MSQLLTSTLVVEWALLALAAAKTYHVGAADRRQRFWLAVVVALLAAVNLTPAAFRAGGW